MRATAWIIIFAFATTTTYAAESTPPKDSRALVKVFLGYLELKKYPPTPPSCLNSPIDARHGAVIFSAFTV